MEVERLTADLQSGKSPFLNDDGGFTDNFSEEARRKYQTNIDAQEELITELKFKVFELESEASKRELMLNIQTSIAEENLKKAEENEKYRTMHDELSLENKRLKQIIEKLENKNQAMTLQLEKSKIDIFEGSQAYIETKMDNMDNINISNKSIEDLDSGSHMFRRSAMRDGNQEISIISQDNRRQTLFGLNTHETFQSKLKDVMNREKQALKILNELEKNLDLEIDRINIKVRNGMNPEFAFKEKVMLERIKDRMFEFINEKFFNEHLVKNALLT